MKRRRPIRLPDGSPHVPYQPGDPLLLTRRAQVGPLILAADILWEPTGPHGVVRAFSLSWLSPVRTTEPNPAGSTKTERKTMKGQFQVINERTDSFVGKRGKVENQVVSLLDQDDQALINTVDYQLSEDEKNKHSGKLVGKRLHLAITDARTGFSGRLRLEGRILEVK